MKTERKVKILLKFVNSKITHDVSDAYSSYTEVDYVVEQESTVDGFEVYTFKSPSDDLCLNEHVYYYDTDLPEDIVKTLLNHGQGDTIIFIDEYLYEDLRIEEQLEDSFVEYVEDIIAQEIDGKGDNILTNKELKELKEEYYVEDEE
jgi:hypothetical protein